LIKGNGNGVILPKYWTDGGLIVVFFLEGLIASGVGGKLLFTEQVFTHYQ
jgi:hypothetical protein